MRRSEGRSEYIHFRFLVNVLLAVLEQRKLMCIHEDRGEEKKRRKKNLISTCILTRLNGQKHEAWQCIALYEEFYC